MGRTEKQRFRLSVELGQRIQAERLVQGYDQEGFALEANVDRSYYGEIERGERNVSMCMLCQIALHMNRDIAFFTQGMPDPEMLAADLALAERMRKNFGKGKGRKQRNGRGEDEDEGACTL